MMTSGTRKVAKPPAGQDQAARKKPLKKRLRRGLLVLGMGLAVLIACLPTIVTSSGVLGTLVDRFAGIEPLHVEFAAVKAGWFEPISAQEIRVLDESGQVLAEVAEVRSEKGLLGWLAGYSDIGTIQIRGAQARIEVRDGTTNLEQAFAPWLQNLEGTDPDSTPVEAEPVVIAGRIELVESKFTIVDVQRTETWEVAVPALTMVLPTAEQLVGPVDVQVELRNAAAPTDQGGRIAAQIKQVVEDQSKQAGFEIRAKLQDLPLQCWHVIKARFPELPVDELQGGVSGVLAGKVVDDEQWSVQLSDFVAADLFIRAPDLVGDAPATLEAIEGRFDCTLQDSQLSVSHTELRCDFAEVIAHAAIPWPMEFPTVAQPFLSGATLSAHGQLDLPKLAVAARTLLPVKKNTELHSGNIEFSLGQVLDKQNRPSGFAKLQVQGLSGVANGQALEWREPLAVELSANSLGQDIDVRASLDAEFASLRGGGNLTRGSLDGSIDLSELRRRLDQWVDLPIQELGGSATLKAAWNLLDNQQLVANGQLTTTPVVIATNTGRELKEPAWDGSFETRLTLVDYSPTRVDSARLELNSEREKVTFQLNDPLALTSTSDSQPAAFLLDLRADLANCNRRGTVWLAEPTGVDLHGTVQLAANGLVDLEHLEILNANWNGQPIQVITESASFSEPKLVGSFKGRVDTQDLTRTVVEKLELTSSSVSLIAEDQANPNGADSRIGRARFIMDLGRLMRNANTGGSSLITAAATPNATTEPSGVEVLGISEGQLAWQVSADSAGVNLLIDTKDLQILASDGTSSSGTAPLWREDQLVTHLEGTWQAATNQVEVRKLELQTPWMQYAGNLSYGSDELSQTVQLNGSATYDASQLSQKLNSYTGGQLVMAGQKTVPVDLNWTLGSEDPSVLSQLNASTSIGWERANVVGIDVGNANIPIQIVAGKLNSAAEIPVSGGALRWDFESDLTANDLVIHQKPMTVLENVAITQPMCNGWLKYVAPLVADATSVEGRLSVRVDEASFLPAQPEKQTVSGELAIHQASVGPGPLSNQVIGLVKQLEAIRKQEFQQVSSTQKVWLDMPAQQIAFQMVDGRVSHQNVKVKIGDASISTRGSVAVNGALQMVATMPIPDDWADKSRWLEGLRGQSLDFPIGGMISNPRVDTRQLANIGQRTVESAAAGLLQQQLNRGLGKLLGEGSMQPNNAQGAEPSPKNPVLGIGEQLLKGEGLNLPGIFGQGK